ncbi:MAG: ankyrin repeat domain-containing protein [Rickettsiales bacterium]
MIRKDDKYALHSAVFEGNVVAIKELLANRAPYNIPDDNGSTPLHFAAMKGNQRAIHLLKVHGAQCNFSDCHGETPLHLVVKTDNLDAVKEIVQMKPDIDARDRFGNTALHYAVDYGNKEIVEYLLISGAKTNFLNENHESPLSIAEKNFKPDIESLLRKYSAKKPMNMVKAFVKSFRIANNIRKSALIGFSFLILLSFFSLVYFQGLSLIAISLCMSGILLGFILLIMDKPYRRVRKIEEKFFNGLMSSYEFEKLLSKKVLNSEEREIVQVINYDALQGGENTTPSLSLVNQSNKIH